MQKLLSNRRLFYTSTATASIATTAAYIYSSHRRPAHIHPPPPPPPHSTQMTTTTTTTSPSTSQPTLSKPYTATFSVPLTCADCVTTIQTALSPLPGLSETHISLSSKLVTTTGTTPPSTIIAAIQSTGRTAILRGSGKGDNMAAVCILETPANEPLEEQWKGDGLLERASSSSVRGLARLIELDESVTMLDLTVTGLVPGRYTARLRERGDVSAGVESVGGVFRGFEGEKDGVLGLVDVGGDGRGGFVGEVGWRVWEVVGRGMVVQRVGDEGEEKGSATRAVLGVVARSAGVWENEKVVCGCSGKTVWEEREEMVGKGIL